MGKNPTKPTTAVKNTAITRTNKGQFVKGNKEGNRNGRPKKSNCVSDLLRNKGDELQPDGKTKLQAVIESLYAKAESGDLKAIDMIFDRVEGKPAQKLEVEETRLPKGFNVRLLSN